MIRRLCVTMLAVAIVMIATPVFAKFNYSKLNQRVEIRADMGRTFAGYLVLAEGYPTFYSENQIKKACIKIPIAGTSRWQIIDIDFTVQNGKIIKYRFTNRQQKIRHNNKNYIPQSLDFRPELAENYIMPTVAVRR